MDDRILQVQLVFFFRNKQIDLPFPLWNWTLPANFRNLMNVVLISLRCDSFLFRKVVKDMDSYELLDELPDQLIFFIELFVSNLAINSE